MNRTTTLATLFALILAHLVLASFYASETPYRTPGVILSAPRNPQTGIRDVQPDIGAPDERQHANYVSHLLDGKGFPVLVWEVPDPQHPGQMMRSPDLGETYQSHQPPAYYLLAAGWSKMIGVDPSSKDDGFKLRFLNVILGCLTVIGVFQLGRTVFASDEAGLLAAAFAALLPMNAALSGAAGNDPLLILLSTWVLALCARAITSGWTWKLVVVVGVLTGIAMLTKTTAAGLLPILLLAVLLKQVQKPSLAMIGACAALALVIVAPWWLRNQHLYGDPLAIKAFNAAFVGSPQASLFIDGYGAPVYWISWVAWWTARSFFGAFGYMDIWLNETGLPASSTPNTLYRLLLAGSALVFMAWGYSRFSKKWADLSAPQLLNEAFFVVVLLLFLKFNTQFFQAQARYILPALGPISCGFAAGLLVLFKDRFRLALGVLAAVLLLVNGYALQRLPGEFEKRENVAVMSLRNHGRLT